MNQRKLFNILKKKFGSNVSIVSTSKKPPLAKILINGHPYIARGIEREEDYDDLMVEVASGPRYSPLFDTMRKKHYDADVIRKHLSSDESWIWDRDSDFIIYTFPSKHSVIVSHNKLRKFVMENIDTLPYRRISGKRDRCVVIVPKELKFIH